MTRECGSTDFANLFDSVRDSSLEVIGHASLIGSDAAAKTLADKQVESYDEFLSLRDSTVSNAL